MNAFEQLGREKKARAIATVVWRMIDPELRTRSDLGASIADLPQEERDSAARAAGQKSPSADTWERVCAMIDEKAAEERHMVAFLDRLEAAS